MTPTRGKRNSKVPERFSSEDLRIETSNSNGITILDYNDKTTSTTHRLAPIGTKIKLKPVVREPLKVKLPKLKRPVSIESKQSQARLRVKSATTNKDNDSNSGLTDSLDIGSQKLNKIKLPSRNPAIDGQVSNYLGNSRQQESQESSKELVRKNSKVENTMVQHATNLNLSSASKIDSSLDEHKNSMMDPFSSSSSSEETNSARMQIVMSCRPQVDASVSDGNNNSDSDIRCPCGVNADLGVMVECEKCSTWQHGHCINVGPEEDAYEGYICAFCLYPQGKHNESLHQLTIGDRFQHKFDQLATLMADQTSRNGSDRLNNENRVHFSINELTDATKDLRRVANSLDVKWKLYLNREYPTDLKIWTNAVWSEKHEENLKQQQQTTCFFGDIYRGNLALNIRNMVRKMSERIELIKNQCSTYTANESNSNDIDSKKMTFIAKLLDEVDKLVEQVRAGLGNVG